MHRKYGINMSNNILHIYDFFSFLLVGAFLGYGFDRYLNSLPVFLIICIVLSVVAGIYNFYKKLYH